MKVILCQFILQNQIVFLGARFSSQKLKIPGWANSIEVHKPNDDSNEEIPSHQNHFSTQISDSDVFTNDNNENQENTEIAKGKDDADAHYYKTKNTRIKDSVRRTQSSPSTHDSGFINDSYAVSSSGVHSDHALDKAPYFFQSISRGSISKESHCSCSQVEGHDEENEKSDRRRKKVSFRKQKEVKTLTDYTRTLSDIHPNCSHNDSIDEDSIEYDDNDGLTHKNTMKINDESEVS